MTEKIPTTQDLLKKSSKFEIIAGGIAVVGLLTAIGLVLSTQGLKGQIKLTQQEIDTAGQSQQTTQAINDLISDNPQEIERLTTALPNQSTIIVFIEEVNALVHEYDKAGIVRFTATNPTKINNQLAIPMYMKANMTTVTLVSFLRRIERLPYLIEITSLDVKSPQGVGGPADVSIGANVYVQDPFTQP